MAAPALLSLAHLPAGPDGYRILHRFANAQTHPEPQATSRSASIAGRVRDKDAPPKKIEKHVDPATSRSSLFQSE